jgi:hypothetical protein
VVEVRYGVSFRLEDLGALLEEVEARKQNLVFIVDRVRIGRALLDDGQDGVDGDAIASDAEGLGDVAAEPEAELFGTRRAEVFRGPGIGRSCLGTPIMERTNWLGPASC